MKKKLIYILFLFSAIAVAQNNLSQLLKKYNTETIPYISVNELSKDLKKYILLDSREIDEYRISHLENALYVGYNSFSIDAVKKLIPNKHSNIVVYCSLGVRSEKIAIRLKNEGFTNIKNLYGGIFQWKNENHKIYNTSGLETEKVHAYSKSWSKWLHKGEKVFN